MNDDSKTGRKPKYTDLDGYKPRIDFMSVGLESYSSSPATISFTPKNLALEAEILALKNQISNLEKSDHERAKKIEEEYQKKENLRHLLGKVNEEAGKKLYESPLFVDLFEMEKLQNVVVMSIDIRRSTEIMLKAKNPHHYALFITTLCTELRDIIFDNYGIFDKFTGDGILAFFPYFFSGTDAIFFALKSASKCHETFERFYKEKRSCFSTVLKEVD